MWVYVYPTAVRSVLRMEEVNKKGFRWHGRADVTLGVEESFIHVTEFHAGRTDKSRPGV
jgi:hypothetical protein